MLVRRPGNLILFVRNVQFVHDGVLYAELNEMLMHELAEDGYSARLTLTKLPFIPGVEIRRTPLRTEIIIRATRTREVLGEKGQRIRELTSAVQKRFAFPEGTVEMFAERVHNRGLSAMAQAESLKFKLLGGLQVGLPLVVFAHHPVLRSSLHASLHVRFG
eukprot:2949079-Rhodomonas_salina.2